MVKNLIFESNRKKAGAPVLLCWRAEAWPRQELLGRPLGRQMSFYTAIAADWLFKRPSRVIVDQMGALHQNVLREFGQEAQWRQNFKTALDSRFRSSSLWVG